MNIKDYKSGVTEEDIPNMFNLIFARQEELSNKYVEIEVKNNLRWTADIPVDLNDPFGQLQLKDYAWRIVEEIGESLESLYITEDGKIHAKEELADGLHFITELLILADIKPDKFNIEDIIYKSIEVRAPQLAVTNFVMFLGMSMNCLKLKPWKNTHYETDKEKFKEFLINAYDSYIVLMLTLMSPIEILDFYFRKSQVNKFRIKSNY